MCVKETIQKLINIENESYDKIRNEYDDICHEINGFLKNSKDEETNVSNYSFKYYIFDNEYTFNIFEDIDNYIPKYFTRKSECKFIKEDNIIIFNILDSDKEKIFNDLRNIIEVIYYGEERHFLFSMKDDTYYHACINRDDADEYISNFSTLLFLCNKKMLEKELSVFKDCLIERICSIMG